MTYQASAKTMGFRPLVDFDLEAVSGGSGEIVVTGSRGGSFDFGSWSGSGDGAGGLSSGFNGFWQGPIDPAALAGLAGLAGIDWDAFWEMQSAEIQEAIERIEAEMQEQQDLDGDGLPGITVERTLVTTVDSEFYGFLNNANGQIDLFRDTVFFDGLFGYYDDYLGRFVSSDPENADLVLTEGSQSRETNSGFNVTIAGNGGGFENGSSFETTSGNTQYFQRVEP